MVVFGSEWRWTLAHTDELSLRLVVDPVYNYHTVYNEAFRVLQPQITKVPGKLSCYFEPSIRARPGSWLARQTLTLGRMRGRGDLIFSPHMILLNSSPWYMDLEHPLWLFTDHYGFGSYDDLERSKWKMQVARKLLERRYCKGILAYTAAAQREIERLFVESDKILSKTQVVYPVTSIRDTGPYPRDFGTRLLFVCANKEDLYRKGIDIALYVQRSLTMLDLDTELWLLGPFSEEDVAEDVPPRCRFIPPVDHHSFRNEILPQVDILLFPSRADTFGMTVLEARASGVVPIATSGPQVFGTAELVEHGRTGFLIDAHGSDEPNSMATVISEDEFVSYAKLLVENQSVLTRMRQRTRESLLHSSFDSRHMSSKMIDILQGFVNREA